MQKYIQICEFKDDMDKTNITLKPAVCHFCGELITKLEGIKGNSVIIHSLDGNHDNWTPANKVPAHRRCHVSYHQSGRHHTEAAKQKISAALTGENNPMFGKHFSHSEEWKKKMSLAHLGEKNPFYGKHHTEETKRKQSETMKGKYKGEEK